MIISLKFDSIEKKIKTEFPLLSSKLKNIFYQRLAIVNTVDLFYIVSPTIVSNAHQNNVSMC